MTTLQDIFSKIRHAGITMTFIPKSNNKKADRQNGLLFLFKNYFSTFTKGIPAYLNPFSVFS